MTRLFFLGLGCRYVATVERNTWMPPLGAPGQVLPEVVSR
jgi:hypothetical protein